MLPSRAASRTWGRGLYSNFDFQSVFSNTYVANVKIKTNITRIQIEIAKIKIPKLTSVLLPSREIPLKSGWYACKIKTDGCKVQEINIALAMRVKDCEANPDTGEKEGIAISDMRWVRGLPRSERNAICYGQQIDTFAIDIAAPPVTVVKKEPKHEPNTTSIDIKHEPNTPASEKPRPQPSRPQPSRPQSSRSQPSREHEPYAVVREDDSDGPAKCTKRVGV